MKKLVLFFLLSFAVIGRGQGILFPGVGSLVEFNYLDFTKAFESAKDFPSICIKTVDVNYGDCKIFNVYISAPVQFGERIYSLSIAAFVSGNEILLSYIRFYVPFIDSAQYMGISRYFPEAGKEYLCGCGEYGVPGFDIGQAVFTNYLTQKAFINFVRYRLKHGYVRQINTCGDDIDGPEYEAADLKISQMIIGNGHKLNIIKDFCH